jgi:ABC-type multidrug transport system ATPase subunit
MLVVNDLQKSFGKQHILQNISYTFHPGSKTVILGSNGSGKSTLMKILSGALEATENPPVYNFGGVEIEARLLGKYVTLAAPYVALNPMFTLEETLRFHADFCPFPTGFDPEEWVQKAGLHAHKSKRLGTYSSGMLQRVKLLLAIASTRPLLLLDEPTSNLDSDGIRFYHDLLNAYLGERTVIVSSNYVETEYSFCEDKFLLEKHY